MGAKASALYEFPNIRQINFSLEALSSNFLAIPDMVERYNKLVEPCVGSNFDQEGLGATHQAPAFEVLLDEDIWKLDDDYLRRPEVALVLDTVGTLRRSLVNLSDDPSTFRGVVFMYGREFDADLPKFTRNLGAQLAPHLAKALELNRFTADLRRRYNAALSVLDKIATGIFILLENGEVILCNRAASETTDDGQAIVQKSDNRIFCRSSDSHAELLDAIRRVSMTATGDNGEAGQFVEIVRPGSDQPLLAVLSPLRDSEFELERDLSGALLTLIDPLKPMKVQPDAIARAYRFTKAETRLCSLLVTGKTTNELSDMLGVGSETVKTHLSSLYAKSGCRNRTQFIWRLFQFAPPIL
ncbi:helix-turn-helix transcriptional regulator [Ruegeria atlantica]|uniref:helix-turn-helix transcriptional regulator n=1 Tax=Ruegeria atlantica TaxID=81569 RepID=UPI0024956042|nr:PAS and helix-turn-helix domain-containing protein [Ruegeria atlantica]